VLTTASCIQPQRLVMLYKMNDGQVAVNDSDYLKTVTRISSHSHELAYQVPIASADYIKFSFLLRIGLLPVTGTCYRHRDLNGECAVSEFSSQHDSEKRDTSYDCLPFFCCYVC